MNKQSIVHVFAVVALAILATALFVLPGLFRVDMVVALGVLSANTATNILYAVGALCAVGAASVGTVTARKALVSRQAIAAKERKALEASKPYVLLSKDESRPEVVKEHLAHVASEYPEIADLIKESLEQLNLLQRHLGNIGNIFSTNAGLLTQGDARFEYSKFEYFLGKVIEEASKDLVPVIYRAFARSGDDDAPIEPLTNALEQINGKNEERVNLARELSDKAAQTATEIDGDTYEITATNQVQELIVRLDQTNRKQVF